MNKEAIIALLTRKVGSSPQYLLDIKVNGTVLVSNQQFSAEDTKAVQNISRQYGSFFEGHTPLLSADK
jgi:hypothetical protein